MNVMHQAITTLQQELEALDQRRGEIARAIETLRPFMGSTPVKRATDVQPVRKIRRPPGGPGPASETVLASLRIRSPQSPGTLADGLKLPRPVITSLVRQLVAIGKVECTGATLNRQVHLLPRPRAAAKEVP